MQALEVRDYEIERRLELYARARLSSDPQAKARARARLMREARLQFDAARIAAHLVPTVAQASGRSFVRRVAMPLLAASVWLIVAVGSISAAQAGGPLYATRLWIETASLPSSGAARLAAEFERLDARLGEATQAAARGDSGAVQAALDAYEQIADETIASAAGDAALEAQVAAALDQHRVVLTAVADKLGAKGNDTATAAVEAAIARAIVHNQATIDRIGTAGSSSGQTDGSKPTTGGSGGGGASNGGTGGPSGATGGGGAGAASSGDPRPSANPGGPSGGNGGGGEKPTKPAKPTPTPESTGPDGGNPVHTPRN